MGDLLLYYLHIFYFVHKLTLSVCD